MRFWLVERGSVMTFRPFSTIYYAVAICLKDMKFSGDVAKHLICKRDFFQKFTRLFYWRFFNLKWFVS